MAQPIPSLPPKLDDNMVPNCIVKGQPNGKKTFNAMIAERRTQYYETDDKGEIFDLFKNKLDFVVLNPVTNTWEPQTEHGIRAQITKAFYAQEIKNTRNRNKGNVAEGEEYRKLLANEVPHLVVPGQSNPTGVRLFKARIAELGPAYNALPRTGDGVQKRIIIDQVKDGLSFLVVDRVTHMFSPQPYDDIDSKIIGYFYRQRKKNRAVVVVVAEEGNVDRNGENNAAHEDTAGTFGDTDTNSVIDLAASEDDSSRRHSSGSSISSGNTVRSFSWANEKDDDDENENDGENNSTASERSSSTADDGGSGKVVKTNKANVVDNNGEDNGGVLIIVSVFGFLCLLALSIVQGGNDDDLQGCYGKNGRDSGYNPMGGGDDDILQRCHGKNSAGSGYNPMGEDNPDVLAAGMADACNVSYGVLKAPSFATRTIDDQFSFALVDYEQKEVIPSKMQAGSILEEQPFPVTDTTTPEEIDINRFPFAAENADGPTIGHTTLLPTNTTVWVMTGILVLILIFKSIVLYSTKDVPEDDDDDDDDDDANNNISDFKDALEEEEIADPVVNPQDVAAEVAGEAETAELLVDNEAVTAASVIVVAAEEGGNATTTRKRRNTISNLWKNLKPKKRVANIRARLNNLRLARSACVNEDE